jgi:hypothetical protein
LKFAPPRFWFLGTGGLCVVYLVCLDSLTPGRDIPEYQCLAVSQLEILPAFLALVKVMLKITYTESGLHLEQLPCTLDDWATRRLMLALRTGDRLFLEPGYASILVPAGLVQRVNLQSRNQTCNDFDLAIAPCDADYVELTLQGIWLTSQPDSAEGVFVALLDHRTEFLVYRLWQATQREPSFLAG